MERCTVKAVARTGDLEHRAPGVLHQNCAGYADFGDCAGIEGPHHRGGDDPHGQMIATLNAKCKQRCRPGSRLDGDAAPSPERGAGLHHHVPVTVSAVVNRVLFRARVGRDIGKRQRAVGR
jgi:hypothetical protein